METRADDSSPMVLWSALALCMAVGPLMLYSISAVSPLVIEDLGLSPSEYGAIATATFGAAAIGCVVLARATDGLGAVRVMVLVSVGSGVGLLAVAAAPSFAWLIAGAALCGVAQSVSNPSTNMYVAGLPARRRSALIGWKQSGVQMSQLLAGVAMPVLALQLGWRVALSAGVVVAVAGVATALLLRSPRPHVVSASGSGLVAKGLHLPPRQRSDLNKAAVRSLQAYTFFIAIGLAATNAYLPLFAHDELGLSIEVAGFTAAVVAVVGLCSRIWWGRQRIAPARTATVLAGLACCSTVGALVAAAAQAGAIPLLWIGSALFGLSALAANSVTMVTLVALMPLEAIGWASGLVATGLYLGFAAGPILFGFLLEATSYRVAWLLPAAAFSIGAMWPLCTRRVFTSPQLSR